MSTHVNPNPLSSEYAAAPQEGAPGTTTTTTTTETTEHHRGHPHTATGTTGTAGTTTTSGEGMGHKLKSGIAAVHGTGEALRGAFNAKVDEVGGDREGVAKNTAVQNQGLSEVETGNFAHGTKNREGVVPGDGERRAY
jgi:hypothetical protein